MTSVLYQFLWQEALRVQHEALELQVYFHSLLHDMFMVGLISDTELEQLQAVFIMDTVR